MLVRFTAVFALLFASVTYAAGQAIRLDSKWWNQLGTDEQDGFILGFYDCHGKEGGPNNASTMAIRSFVTAYLSRHPNAAIPTVLTSATNSMHEPPPSPGGEVYPGPHGWLDGDWWGVGLDGYELYQTGYVEGYFQCRSHRVLIQQVTRGVQAVNKRFASVPVSTPVADVLQHVIDAGLVQP